MSVGLIKSGGYVPCGASATLMSQYPMKPTTDVISVTASQLYAGWTAPCTGELNMHLYFYSPNSTYVYVNGVSFGSIGAHPNSGGVVMADTITLNKGDIVTTSSNIGGADSGAEFRPFAVGEVL